MYIGISLIANPIHKINLCADIIETKHLVTAVHEDSQQFLTAWSRFCLCLDALFLKDQANSIDNTFPAAGFSLQLFETCIGKVIEFSSAVAV